MNGPVESAIFLRLNDFEKAGFGCGEFDLSDGAFSVSFGDGLGPSFSVEGGDDLIASRVVFGGGASIEGDLADFGDFGELNLDPHAGDLF